MTTPPWEDPRVRAGLVRQFATRRELLEQGATRIGWKVGFGAPAALESMEISSPLLGFLTDATVYPSGSTVGVEGWRRGVVEFEVAVRIAHDLDGPVGREEAREAVAAIAPSIELADITIDPLEAGQVEAILASNIFHRGVVFGEPDAARSGLDISGLEARIVVDGADHAVTTDLEALTGSFDQVVATVAGTLSAMGDSLREGDVVITGSVVPPVPVTQGSTFVFELEPFAPISVTVEGSRRPT